MLLFRGALTDKTKWGGLQAIAGRITADAAMTARCGRPMARVLIKDGDAPLGDPSSPRAEVAGPRDANRRAISFGQGSGHVVIAGSVFVPLGFNPPSYPGSAGLWSVGPFQIHGGDDTTHPPLAIRFGQLDKGGPCSLGLAVCGGVQPSNGVNLPGRFVVQPNTLTDVLLSMDLDTVNGRAELWCGVGGKWGSKPVAEFLGPTVQVVKGVVDTGMYLKAGHYCSRASIPVVPVFMGPISIGNSWSEVLS